MPCHAQEGIVNEEWMLLVDGMGGNKLRVEMMLEKFPNPNSSPGGFKDEEWKFILGVDKGFGWGEGLARCIIAGVDVWLRWKNGKNPHLKKLPISNGEGAESGAEEEKAEGKNWEKDLTQFQKLILVKNLCPSHSVAAVRKFVETNLGKEFAKPKIENGLSAVVDSMDAQTPCLFVLSSGSDPMSGWVQEAKRHKAYENAKVISLGQGQGSRATGMIESGKRIGCWVMLQNCHLAKGFLLELEKIVCVICDGEGVAAAHNTSGRFRLFLTSMPVGYFPTSILQSCIKLTTEPPLGIRATMIRAVEVSGVEGGGGGWSGVEWRGGGWGEARRSEERQSNKTPKNGESQDRP